MAEYRAHRGEEMPDLFAAAVHADAAPGRYRVSLGRDFAWGDPGFRGFVEVSWKGGEWDVTSWNQPTGDPYIDGDRHDLFVDAARVAMLLRVQCMRNVV